VVHDSGPTRFDHGSGRAGRACWPYLIAAPILAVRLLLGTIQRGSHIAWCPYLIVYALTTQLLTT